MINVYNLNIEDYTDNENDFYIGYGSPLCNPYSLNTKHKSYVFTVKSHNESMRKFSDYYDLMYGSNIQFTNSIDAIYEKYKNGQDVYLGCFCKKYSIKDRKNHEDECVCHGDIIKEKLQQRLVAEKLKGIMNSNKE